MSEERTEMVMKNIAVVSGIDDFAMLVGQTGYRQFVIDDTRYIRIAKPRDCMGWRFNDYTVLGDPSRFEIDMDLCMEEIITRLI